MAQLTSQQIINEGIKRGASYKKIGDVLEKYGYNREYNPLLQSENYKQLLNNTVRNAKEMARDVRTFGGMILQPANKAFIEAHNAPSGEKLNRAREAFLNAVNNDKYRKTIGGMATGAIAGSFIPKVGPIAGGLIGAGYGQAGSIKNLADALLHPYGTSIDDIRQGKTSWRDIAQGVASNPLYTAMDTAPLYSKGLTKIIDKTPEYLPKPLQQIFPTKEMRSFNRDLSNYLTNAQAGLDTRYSGYRNISNMVTPNREKLVKYIMTNEGKLTAQEKLIGDEIVKNLRETENDFLSRGYGNIDDFRDNAIAQYVMYMDKDLGNLVHDDIYQIIRGGDLRTGNGLPSKKKIKEIKELADKGGKLYDEGKISYYSQIKAPARQPGLEGIASELNKDAQGYFDTNRIIGKQSTDKLANVFDNTIKFQLDQFNKYLEAEDAIKGLANKRGFKTVTNAKDFEVPEGKVLFSTDAFRDYIQKHGIDTTVEKALRNSNIKKEGAYIIDEMYMDMINNAFKKAPNTGARKLLNAFKKAVLANPHWTMLNRIGNWSNHFMSGGTIKDYRDAKIARREGLIPEQLEHQTSFASYTKNLETGESMGIKNTLMKPFVDIQNAWGEFKNTKGTIGDYGNAIAKTLGATSDITANPWYKLESVLEYGDRSANFVHEAKKLANKEGKSWKKVLKETKENQELFNKINTEVNKNLGDYIGRNYAIPSGTYNFLSEAIPFYRFLSQTGRTTAHQLAHNPLGFMANVTMPSRVAHKKSEKIIKKFKLDRDKYRGGVPYSVENGNVRTIGYEPLPAPNVLEQFANMLRGEDLTGIFGPYIGTLPDILQFRKFGRTATNPRLTKYKLTDYQKANDFKPTLGEVGAYGLNTLLQTLYHPYRLGTRDFKEIWRTASGKGLQSAYDTNAFVENPLSFRKELPTEIIGKYAGIQTDSNYQKRKPTRSQKARNKRKEKYARKGMEQNRNRKIGE